MNIIAFALLWTMAMIATGQAAETPAFPTAGAGVVRYVLPLPSQDDESQFKLQLIVGKTVRIDAQNNYFFGGRIEEEKMPGLAGNLFRVTSLGPITGSRMAVDPETPLVDRFVTLGGEPYLIRYNSRLPVVIYVPEGAEVRYRLWSAGPEIPLTAEGGELPEKERG